MNESNPTAELRKLIGELEPEKRARALELTDEVIRLTQERAVAEAQGRAIAESRFGEIARKFPG